MIKFNAETDKSSGGLLAVLCIASLPAILQRTSAHRLAHTFALLANIARHNNHENHSSSSTSIKIDMKVRTWQK